ncbi:3-oxosteroid 1-dehydrogenase [Caballeronia sordidicola]|uniref:3-oxosteroid 1-dehydrogenase n=1 Tax=Caballeronia sordidicola TaxID=196367 RepID=A0A226XAX4_CABSO|nr:3-oxosteroid 1-dehydrogenase [Caballeronia sordidicola]
MNLSNADLAIAQAREFDIVVIGSGGAGLMSALAAARAGARVLLVEKSSLLGGTTAISGGQIWLPGNPHMEDLGRNDDRYATLAYLRQVTLGSVPEQYLEAFADAAPGVVTFIESATDLRLFAVDRPDYHAEWPGACDGRSLEPLPFTHVNPAGYPSVRRSRYRRPVTSVESRQNSAADLADQREKNGQLTQGAALVAALVEACAKAGVEIIANARFHDFSFSDGRISGVRISDMDGGVERAIQAHAVILACGGFEWNTTLTKAFFGTVPQLPVSPPFNEGDGLLAGLCVGAQLANMGESWWTAAIQIPGEAEDGQAAARNVVRELALPGSIMVNRAGHRFANEASSYNDLGKAFLRFDPKSCTYPNDKAWLVFDSNFKRRYNVLTVSKNQPPPDWFIQADSPALLAKRIGVSPVDLQHTVAAFNDQARHGVDQQFGRGDSRHDQFYGDIEHKPNACLAPLDVAPFYAVPISLGNLGTKGGLATSLEGAVLDREGNAIAGLFACGNVAASWMGLGYPGAGGSLGPILTAALLCGREIVRSIGFQDLNAV